MLVWMRLQKTTACLLELVVELKPSPKLPVPSSHLLHSISTITEAATVLTSALAPTGRAQGLKSSLAKLIKNRSNLYKQLSELQALKGAGILTEEEYMEEKATIMEILKQLKSKSI